MGEPVDLDSLTPKQLNKEFKASQKDIKSKDPESRARALEKFKNPRYYIDGGCFPLFINSLVPKKKTLEYAKTGIEHLLETYENLPNILLILRKVYDQEKNLNVLKCVTDILAFKEEIKKPKKKKKGEEPDPIPPEDPQYGHLRRCSLKAVYQMVWSFYTAPKSDNDMRFAFAGIEHFAVYLADTLEKIVTDLAPPSGEEGAEGIGEGTATASSEGTPSESVLQDGIYCLMSIVFVLTYDKSSIPSVAKSLVTSVVSLSKQKNYQVYCLQILQLISTNKDGVTAIGEHISVILSLLTVSAQGFLDAAAAAAEPVGKKGAPPPKKEEKPKKGAPAVVDPVDPWESIRFIKIQTNNASMACIKLSAQILANISRACGEGVVNESVAQQATQKFAQLILNTVVWETCNNSSPVDPLDVPLTDSVDLVCACLGEFGALSATVRKEVCRSGGLGAILSLLLKSSTAANCSSVEKGSRLLALRRAAEKAALHLLTSSSTRSGEEDRGSPSPSATLKANNPRDLQSCSRWNSASVSLGGMCLDDELFTGELSEGLISQFVQLIGFASSSSSAEGGNDVRDFDISSRGIRLLLACLSSAVNADELVVQCAIDTKVTGKLSTAVFERLQALHAQVSAAKPIAVNSAAAAAAVLTKDEKNDAGCPEEGEDGPITVDAAAAAVDSTSVVDTTTPPAAPLTPEDYLAPTVAESLYMSFCLLEIFFKGAINSQNASSSIQCINTFCSKETVAAVANVLCALGPAGVEAPDAFKSAANSTEFEIPIFDPRRFPFIATNPVDAAGQPLEVKTQQADLHRDSVFLRTVMLDTLSIAASAAEANRSFEGDVPVGPCVGLPLSTSPCEDASLTVCKLCSDAVVSVVLARGRYTVCAKSKCISVGPASTVGGLEAPSAQHVLEQTVLDAALGLLRSIANNGPLGTAAAVESIAELGFGGISNCVRPDLETVQKGAGFSMSGLAEFLHGTTMAGEGEIASLLPDGSYQWKRPLFFTDVFPARSSPAADAEDGGGDSPANNHPETVEPISALSQVHDSLALWPFWVLCSSALCVISDPLSATQSSSIAIDILKALSKTKLFDDNSQPVLMDICAAAVLSLGGAVSLIGCIGKFGNADKEMKEKTVELLQYLFSRGSSRETFWQEWAVEHKVEIPIDPKTGKPIVKKEEKKKEEKKGKVDPKAVVVEPVVAAIVYNLESTEEIPDPNRGPTTALWRSLLDIQADDHHTQSFGVSALSTCVMGCDAATSDLAIALINLQVDLNATDVFGRTPLMYALLLQDVNCTNSLVEHGADLDALDIDSNPTIKFALLSLYSNNIASDLTGYCKHAAASRFPAGEKTPPTAASPHFAFWGYPALLESFLQSDVDVAVSDSQGYSPIMQIMGLGSLDVVIGGYFIHVTSAGYNFQQFSYENITQSVEMLADRGVSVNFCSRSGATPLHIAAARGHMELVQVLIRRKAIPNAQNIEGYTPMHYLAAACPTGAISLFDYLMDSSLYRPLERMTFEDNRTGFSHGEKDLLAYQATAPELFIECVSPSAIGKRNMTAEDLLQVVTDSNTNIVQIVLGAQSTGKENELLSPFIVGEKAARLDMALHVLSRAGPSGSQQLLSNVDNNGMNALHAACLCLRGTSERKALTDQQMRRMNAKVVSLRIKSYESTELNILDKIFTALDSAGMSRLTPCPMYIPEVSSVSNVKDGWTAMHAAMVLDNHELALTLMGDEAYDLEFCKPLHSLARSPNKVSAPMAKLFVDACSKSSAYKALLNEHTGEQEVGAAARPLHVAVRNKQWEIVKALAACHKADMSIIDEITGRTALQEACSTAMSEAVAAFEQAKDRLDFVLAGTDGKNCVDIVVDARSADGLEKLVAMRRNDVIEVLLSMKDTGRGSRGEEEEEEDNTAAATTTGESFGSTSLLLELENEHLQIGKLLNIELPEDPAAIAAAAALAAEEEEKKVAAAAAKAAEEGDQDDVAAAIAAQEEAMKQITDGVADMTVEEGGGGGGAAATATTSGEAVPALVPVQLSKEEREAHIAALQKNISMLSIIFKLLASNEAASEAAHHAHDMFGRGELLSVPEL